MSVSSFMLAIIILVGLGWHSLCVEADCGPSTFTMRHGHFYYEIWNSSGEVCDWLFVPPDNRTDVMLLVTVPHIVRYTDDYWKDSVIMPDGSILPHDNTSREYTHSTAAWCGLFVTPNTSSEKVTCPAGRNVKNVCANPTKESQTWPPRIRSDSHYYYALFSFAFIDCPSIERTDGTQANIKEETTTANQAVSTTERITTASTKTSGDNEAMVILKKDFFKIKVVAIVMGILAVFLFITIVAVFLHFRRNSSSSFDSPVAFRNENFKEETSMQNMNHYHNIDSANKV